MSKASRNGAGRPRSIARAPADDVEVPILQVAGITVSFGGVIAVDDVTFTVPRGGIVGLIGPNGAGKTTLFDVICGFVTPDSGRIALDRKEITKMSPSERARNGLGRSFQDARLFGSLTVAEALSCALERKVHTQGPVSTVLGLPWIWTTERSIQARVDELVELLGLGAFHDKFVSELSTGSRRIVDLACVLAHQPSVLLLDEPSSGIAQRETEALGPLLVRVKEALGCTMLLVEHDMPLVTSIADELIALETGRVIARGSPTEVTNDPLVVEAYLGTDERVVLRSGSVNASGSRSRRAKQKAKPKRTRATGSAGRASGTRGRKPGGPGVPPGKKA